MADTHRKKYYYVVSGGGAFPLDMLRYDASHPEREVDSGAIASTFRGVRWAGAEEPHVPLVRLVSYYPPTDGRWQSFGWHVVTVDERKI